VKPSEIHQICRLIRNKDFENAKEINNKLLSLHKAMFVESNPIPVKWLLSYLGLIKPFMRLPMSTLEENNEEFILKALERANA
jgi:4-hydroxy-tetrahydrodipicolinate synthase